MGQQVNQASEERKQQSPTPTNSEGDMDEVPLSPSPEMDDIPLDAGMNQSTSVEQVQNQFSSTGLEDRKQEKNGLSTFTSTNKPGAGAGAESLFAAIGMPPPPFSL